MPQRSDPPTLPTPLSGPLSHAGPTSHTAPLPPLAAALPAAAQASGAAPAGLSMPLGTLTLLFMLGSVIVAALAGYGLAAWLQPVAPWMVGLAAAAGVLCTAVPLGVALVGLARRSELPGAASLGATAAAVGGRTRSGGSVGSAAEVRAAATPSSTPSSAVSVSLSAASSAAPTAPAPLAGSSGVASGVSAAQRVAPGMQGVVLTREHFMDMVGREWSRARRYGTGAALLLVDIDRYPRLVDALGDTAGEKVLADLIATTAPTLRGADALARFGEGQFAVFLAHADATGALDVAERVRERAEQMEVAVPPRRVRFTVGVGVAHLRPAHLHLQALMDDVIDALAAARAAGGNCVRAAPVEIGPRPAPGGAARGGSRADKK